MVALEDELPFFLKDKVTVPGPIFKPHTLIADLRHSNLVISTLMMPAVEVGSRSTSRFR
jgi:hypothetical protein